MNKTLSILVQTCNRKQKLLKCLNSIYCIFNDQILANEIDVILSDNSSQQYEPLDMLVKAYKNLKYINLRYMNGNIGLSYLTTISKIETPYLLIIEDDDQLQNKAFHLNIYKDLNIKYSNTIISFMYSMVVIDIHGMYATYKKLKCMNFQPTSITIHNAPYLWNGEFKLDVCYYPTYKLKDAITLWLKDEVHMYDGSSDEAIVLLMLNNNTMLQHKQEHGLFVTYDKSNESLENIEMTLYSSRSYIKELAKICNLSNEWINMYEQIQLNELNDNKYSYALNKKIFSYNDVYNNSDIYDIETNVRKMINNNSFQNIKNYIQQNMKQIVWKLVNRQ